MNQKILSTFFLLLISPNLYAVYQPDPKTVPANATAEFKSPRMRTSSYTPGSGFSKMGIRCNYVKGGNFDPIVFPGQTNVGHHHTFLGNTGIAPASTGQSLLQSGGSNCMGGSLANSSFWLPSTIDIRNNQFVAPVNVAIYYTAFGRTSSNNQFRNYIKPIPHGFKMLPRNSFTYHCLNSKGQPGIRSNTQIPVCNEQGGYLVYQLHSWPHCWDGKNLDSADHKSHVVFSITGDWHKNPNECPSTHPVRIPQLNVLVTYPFKQSGETRNWRLASDTNTALPGSSLHGDYMSALNQNIQQVIIQNCLIANKDCSIGKLGLGFNNLLGAGTNGKLYELFY